MQKNCLNFFDIVVMYESIKQSTCERLFRILQKGIPMLFEAENFVEKQQRISPNPVFIESRDILSHLRDIAENCTNEDNINKNIIEIQEHIRRGIIETYQEYYEYLAANIYNLYGKYKKSYIKFEKLLGLYNKHKAIHDKIKSTIAQSQTLWMEARSLKTNEFDTEQLHESISKFQEASNTLGSIEDSIDLIYNNLYKRITIPFIMFWIVVIVVLVIL